MSASVSGAGPVSAVQAELCIRSVAVIGAGEQGRAFALRCALAGFDTVLEDVMPAKLRKAEAALAGPAGAEIASRLSFALTVEDAVREADIVVDFVPDELESKLEIFSLIDRMAPPKTLICTPTQALSISDLAACTYRADRCVALRADGAELTGDQLVLIRGSATTQAVLDATATWLRALGIAPEVAEEGNSLVST